MGQVFGAVCVKPFLNELRDTLTPSACQHVRDFPQCNSSTNILIKLLGAYSPVHWDGSKLDSVGSYSLFLYTVHVTLLSSHCQVLLSLKGDWSCAIICRVKHVSHKSWLILWAFPFLSLKNMMRNVSQPGHLVPLALRLANELIISITHVCSCVETADSQWVGEHVGTHRVRGRKHCEMWD